MAIQFVKGDTHETRVTLKTLDVIVDKMILQVKDSYGNVVIYKDLKSGIKYIGNDVYIIRFDKEDTANILNDVFEFNLAMFLKDIKKTLVIDYLVLTDKPIGNTIQDSDYVINLSDNIIVEKVEAEAGPNLLDISNIKSLGYLYQDNTELIEAPEINTTKIENTQYMYSGCTNLVKVPEYDLSSCNSARFMFYNCPNIEEVKLSNTSNVTNFQTIFGNCIKLRKVEIDFTGATQLTNAFTGCESLEEIILTGTIKTNISVADTILNHGSITNIINALVDLTGTTAKTLTLGDNIGEITEEEKAVAINKNWKVL